MTNTPTPVATATPPPTPASYSQAVQADGAIAYFRMNESAGLTAFDSSGFDRNATYSESPGSVQFQRPSLLSADNDSSVLIQESGVTLQPSARPGQETIEGWFRPTGPVEAKALIVRVDENANWRRMLWITRTWPEVHRFAYSFFVAGIQHNVVGTTVATLGTTYYVAATIDYSGANTTVRLYVNGFKEAELSTPGVPSADTRWQIGLEAGGGLDDFPGFVDEVAFYNSALSNEQIAEHYSRGTVAPPLPADP